MSILKYQSVQLFGAKLINFIAVIVILFTVSVKMSHAIKHQYMMTGKRAFIECTM
jgi:hypothetical protein